MAHTLNTFATRATTAQHSNRPRATDDLLASTDHDDGILRLLMLVPVGSLLVAGLLLIALARIVGAPALTHSPSREYADAHMESPAMADVAFQ
jgi:hypothetical protein